MFKKKTNEQKIAKTKEKNIKTTPYDNEYKVTPLKLLCIIVNKGQGDFYIKTLINTFNVSTAFLVNGNGTASVEIYELLGIGEAKKDIVFALVKEDIVEPIFKVCEDRFKISRNANGVVFTSKLNSIASVLMYRFLTDTKINIKKEK